MQCMNLKHHIISWIAILDIGFD